jgi:hypothetical protein
MNDLVTNVLTAVYLRERRNRAVNQGCIALFVLLSIAAFLLGYVWFSCLLAASVAAITIGGGWYVLAPGLKPLTINDIDIATLIDRALPTKDRAATLTMLTGEQTPFNSASRDLIRSQLHQIFTRACEENGVPLFPTDRAVAILQIAPLTLSPCAKRSLVGAAGLSLLIAALIFFRPIPPLERLANELLSTLDQTPTLPQPLREQIEQFADSLSSTTSADASAAQDLLHTAQQLHEELTQLASSTSSDATTVAPSSQSATKHSSPNPASSPKGEPVNRSAAANNPGLKNDKEPLSRTKPETVQKQMQKDETREPQQPQHRRDKQEEKDGAGAQQNGSANGQSEQQSQQKESSNGSSEGGKKDSDSQQSSQKSAGGSNGGGAKGDDAKGAASQGSSGAGTSNQGDKTDETQSSPQNRGNNDQGNNGNGNGSDAGNKGDSKEQRSGTGSQKDENGTSGESASKQGSEQGKEGKGGDSPQQKGGSPQQQGDSQKGAGNSGETQGTSMQKLANTMQNIGQQLQQMSAAQENFPSEGSNGQSPGSDGDSPDGSENPASPPNPQQPGKGRSGDGKKPNSEQGRQEGTNPSGDSPTDRQEQQRGQGGGSDNSSKNSSQERQDRSPTPNSREGSAKGSGEKSSLPKEGGEIRDVEGAEGGPPGADNSALTSRREVLQGLDEQFDSRFTEKNSSIEKNTQPARPKITIEEMDLQKPKGTKEKGEQPIPLEYRDSLR